MDVIVLTFRGCWANPLSPCISVLAADLVVALVAIDSFSGVSFLEEAVVAAHLVVAAAL